jgi:protein-tyrosine-phosphatase
MKDVLFVCTANMCRSPLAQAIAADLAERRGLHELRFESAGRDAFDGRAATDHALAVAGEHGLDLAGHRSRPLTPELVERADVVVALDRKAREAAERLGGSGKTQLLEVADPVGRGIDEYRRTFARLERELDPLVETL